MSERTDTESLFTDAIDLYDAEEIMASSITPASAVRAATTAVTSVVGNC